MPLEDYLPGGSKAPGTKATSTTLKPVPSTPAPQGGVGLAKFLPSGGAPKAAASPAPPGGKSFLGRARDDAVQAVENVPRGLLGLVRAAGSEAANTVKGLNPIYNQHMIDSYKSMTHDEQRAAEAKRAPLTNMFVHSFGATGTRLIHPTQAVRDYSAHPIGSLLEDAANASLVLGPVAEATGTAARTAEEAGKAGTLTRSAELAGKAAKVTNAIATAPMKPFELGAQGIGKAGAAAYEAAAGSEGRAGQALRAMRLDPASRLVKNEALVPANDAVSEAVGQQVDLARQISKVLPNPDEQVAARLIAEGEAGPLAKARAVLPADQFEEFAAKRYGESVTPAALHTALDVVDGKAPEVAARIDQALEIGRTGQGGRLERTANYLGTKPSRQWEAGFDPNPVAVHEATVKAMAPLRKAERLASTLRDRADLAAERAGAAGSEASASHADLSGRVSEVQRTAVELDRAAGRLRAVRRAGVDAENTIASRAEEVAAKQATQDTARVVRETRRAVQTDLRSQADSLRATIDDIGRPAKPPTRLLSGARSPMADAAKALEAEVGAGWASHNLWAKAGERGMPLDTWLDEWNRRNHVTEHVGGGMGDQAVVEHAAKALAAARRMRSLAAGSLSKGFPDAVFEHVNTYGDPMLEHALTGTVDEAVSRLARHEPGVAGQEALGRATSNVLDEVPRGRSERVLALLGPARTAADEARVAATESAAGLRRAVGAGGASRERLGQLEAKARMTESVAKRAEQVVQRLEAKVPEATRQAIDDPHNAPARLRPAIDTGRAVAAELGEHAKAIRAAGDHAGAALAEQAASEVPTTLAALRAAGVDYDHFVHVQIGDKPGGGYVSGDSFPRVRKTRAEKFRTGSADYDRTVPAQAKAEIDELKGGIMRSTAEKIQSMPFARKFASPAEAAAAEYVAWDPKNIFEKNPNPGPDTVYVPKHVFDGFKNYFNDPKWDRVLQATYDPAVRVWKTAVLPLSPSWQVGNLVGNAAMATLGAGIGPARLAASMVEAIKAYRASGEAGERSFQGPRRLYTAGPTFEEFDFLRNAGQDVGGSAAWQAARKVVSPLATVVRKSYAMNQFIDDLGRSAVFIAKKGEGLSDEAAVRESLKAMGDFSRMSPFEKRVVKRVLPFYAWSRHITQLAFRLPIEHPLRVAWTLHLANQFGAPDPDMEGLPGSSAGAIPLPGGKLLGTGSLFPFGDAGKALTPGGFRQGLSPFIKLEEQLRTGINQFTGRPFTRPAGTAKRDEYGRELPTAPSVVKQVTDLVPQKRLYESLTGRNNVVRYDSGDKVETKTGPIPSDKTAGQALLRALGFPVSDRAAAVASAARAAEAKAKLDKAKASYLRRSKRK